MKVKINAELLRGLFSELLPFAKTLKNVETKEVSRSAHLVARDGVLQIYTGDFRYNYYGERYVRAHIIQEGEAGIEIAQAIDVLGVLDNEIEIEIQAGLSGHINTGLTTLPLRGSADPIKRIEPPSVGWVTIDKADNLIQAAAVADRCRRQDDDLQYDINGLCLLPTPQGLELVGSDGNHLMAVATNIPNCIESLVVCQPNLAKALSVFDKKHIIQLLISEGCIWIRQEGRLNTIGRLAGDNYPNYLEIVDSNPNNLGILHIDDIGKLNNVIRKHILEPTPQGLIRLYGENNTLFLNGRNKKFQFASRVDGIKLPPIACNANGFAKMVSLFDASIELQWSQKMEHLYLKQGRKFAIISLEKDYFAQE